MYKLLFVFVVMSNISALTQCYVMNMTKYYQMPPLYDFDDYDRCLQEYSNAVNDVNEPSMYCFVRADVEPQADSSAWQTIVEISQYKRHHFNHRHLYFGICMRSCLESLAAIDDVPAAGHANANATKALFTGILTENTKVNVYLQLFASEAGNRARYNRLANECVNLRLRQRHGLSAKSVVEYCDSNARIVDVDDAWNILFYGCICMLILLTTLSSLYDLYLKQQRKDKVMLKESDHYRTPPKCLMQKLCVSFSIARNWYRLNQEPTGKLGRDLRFLDCFKFFSMFLVIFAHTNWVIYESAISNPQDPERLLHTTAGTLLISGALITVTFFVISGLLLTINWLAVAKTQPHLGLVQYIVLFVKFNIFRYIRLTVPYAFVILLSGVYFDNAGGPLWRHIIEREQLACRKNWWVNLLYINNFMRTDERCLLQGWYLASDTHSFILSLLLLMLAHKYAQWRKQIYAVTLASFVALPALLTYVMDYYPIFLPTPQTQKDSFIEDRQFNEFYTSFHMNFGCYFCGVLAALVYDQLTNKQYKLRDNRVFQLVWYALIPIGILWLFSAHPIYQHYYTATPILWGSIYAGLQRNAWAFGLAIFIVGLTAKVGWIIRKFACLPIFRILGRLTYGAFIIHLLIARIVLATIREPIYFGTGMMFAFIFFTASVSYLSSLVLAIFLELPVSSLLKLAR